MYVMSVEYCKSKVSLPYPPLSYTPTRANGDINLITVLAAT